MKCSEAQRAHLKWENLSRKKRRQVAYHLNRCSACRQEAAQWEQFLRAWRSSEPPAVSPEDFLHRWHARLERLEAQQTRRRWTIAAPLAAALALLLAGGGLWWRLHPPSPSEAVNIPYRAVETLDETQRNFEARVLELLDMSILTLQETEDEKLCSEEIL